MLIGTSYLGPRAHHGTDRLARGANSSNFLIYRAMGVLLRILYGLRGTESPSINWSIKINN